MQIGCDILFDLVKRLKFNVDSTVVPVINLTGSTISFFVVYALPTFYPVPLYVSKNLDFLIAEDRKEIAYLLFAIIEYSKMLLQEFQAFAPTSRDTTDTKIVNIILSQYFLKPVQVYTANDLLFTNRMTHLISIYERLFRSPEARKYCIFPKGFLSCSASNEGTSANQLILDRLKSNIPHRLWRAGVSGSEVFYDNRPIRIYEDNKKQGYQDVSTIPEEYVKKFYRKVKDACAEFMKLGICHYDLRLKNILFRINEVDHDVEIKVIDWDYAGFFGEQLEGTFYQIIQELTTYPHGIAEASDKWYEFYLKQIKQELQVEDEDEGEGGFEDEGSDEDEGAAEEEGYEIEDEEN